MINSSSFLWFLVMFFFLFLEMGHPGLLYFLSFSCGAAGAGIVSWYQISDSVEYLVFLLGTVLSLGILHLIFKSKSHEKIMYNYASNADALIGKKVIVFCSQENEQVWQAHVLGQVWTVRAMNDKPLQQGQQVIVVGVQGCHLQVDYHIL